MAQPAAPPTPQEVSRKLSIHSAVKPKVRAVAGVSWGIYLSGERRFHRDLSSPCFGLDRLAFMYGYLWHRIGFGFS